MTSSHDSPNGSDLERLNDPNAAQEEGDESESDASTSNRDINGRNNNKAMGLHSSSAHLKCRGKPSDIHSQSRLTTYRVALYFECSHCTQKDKEGRGTKNIRDHLDRFPLLSTMAMDIFSIPAMSSKPRGYIREQNTPLLMSGRPYILILLKLLNA